MFVSPKIITVHVYNMIRPVIVIKCKRVYERKATIVDKYYTYIAEATLYRLHLLISGRVFVK